jgi:hypothetical protein
MLPSYSQVLFFIRDPFVLAVYVTALTSGNWPTRRPTMYFGVVLAVMAFGIATIQVAVGGAGMQFPLLVASYGWRNYFFYIPLAYIVADVFRAEDIARIARWTLWLAVPIAALVMVQFYAPGDSWINVGTGDLAENRFVGLSLNLEHTRPMGTFTSDQGQREFTISALAMLAALVINRRDSRFAVSRLVIWTSAFALLICIGFSGSRGSLAHAGIVLVASALAIALRGGAQNRGRALLALGALVAVAVIAYPIVFRESFSAFSERWQTADAYESTIFHGGFFGRALYGLVDFVRLMGFVPLQGYGLGLGGNASSTLGLTIDGMSPLALAETDFARHIVDLGPIVGVLFIVFRIAVVASLVRVAFAALRRGQAMAALLLTFVGLDLATGQITGHGTVNGYAWLFCGLCFAAAQMTDPDDRDGSMAARAPAPRFPDLLR